MTITYLRAILKHVLTIKNIFTVCLVYTIVIISIILYGTDFPKNFDKSQKTIAVYSTSYRIGEKLLYDRTLIAAKNLGWNVLGSLMEEEYLPYIFCYDFFYNTVSKILNYIYHPEFNLILTHYVKTMPSGYNVVYLNMPNNFLFENSGADFKKQFIHLAKADAYLDIHSMANNNNKFLLNALMTHNKKANIMPFYFGHYYVPYQNTKQNKLLLTGSTWGSNRDSIRLFYAFKRLADEGHLVAYGLKEYMKNLGTAFKGQVEEFEPNSKMDTSEKLTLLQRKYGISLVLHSLEHMLDGIPTSRILESVSSGVITISDNNKFVRQLFKDSILYLDTLTDDESIYIQLKNHIDWIKKNPQEVRKKTLDAYEVFQKNFVLENQLNKIYEFVKQNKNIQL